VRAATRSGLWDNPVSSASFSQDSDAKAPILKESAHRLFLVVIYSLMARLPPPASYSSDSFQTRVGRAVPGRIPHRDQGCRVLLRAYAASRMQRKALERKPAIDGVRDTFFITRGYINGYLSGKMSPQKMG
jgi:hypothetical protein